MAQLSKFLIECGRYQGLSQLSVLRRQFLPSRPLEGDKREQLGDKIFVLLLQRSAVIELPWWHLDVHVMINAWLELLFSPKRQK